MIITFNKQETLGFLWYNKNPKTNFCSDIEVKDFTKIRIWSSASYYSYKKGL